MEGKYIVFDGMDGCGKGTQMNLLKDVYGSDVTFTREPGGTKFAEEIRKILLDNPLAGKSTALNNFLLFWVAREDLQQNLISPALQEGKYVFSDRGDSSTFAFQLYGEEHKELFNAFDFMREHVFRKSLERKPPDLYIIFDLPAEEARERVIRDKCRKANHFDVRDLEYYKRVQEGFYEFAKYQPVEFIDATKNPEQMHTKVLEILAKKLK